MSKEISVNSVELISATVSASLAISRIDANIEKWTNQGEKSESLQSFAEQFVELEKAMQLYQKLLEQDINSIRKIGEEFFLSDFKLACLWKRK